MPETIESIVKASQYPLSVIIVGVDDVEYDGMEELDCDKGVLVDGLGNKAARDIVQFVSFKNFSGNPIALASEVLREVPNQLTEYMRLINYVPELPEERPISQLVVPVENLIAALNLKALNHQHQLKMLIRQPHPLINN